MVGMAILPTSLLPVVRAIVYSKLWVIFLYYREIRGLLMAVSMRKSMSPLLGAIGKRPCEVKLQSILQELGNRVIVNKIFRTLDDFRVGLKQLSHIPEWRWEYRFLLDFKEKVTAQLTKTAKEQNIPEIAYTHALCCLAAYFRETVRERAIARGTFLNRRNRRNELFYIY